MEVLPSYQFVPPSVQVLKGKGDGETRGARF